METLNNKLDVLNNNKETVKQTVKESKEETQKRLKLELKKDTATIIKDSKKEKISLNDKKLFDILNSKDLIKDISNVKVKESKKESKESMYKYNFLYKKLFNLDYSKQSKDTIKIKDKKLRQVLRNKRNSFANNIILYAQKKELNNLKESLKNFNSFYKESYSLNDYSLQSISSNNRDEETTKVLTTFLKIVVTFK